MSLDKYRSKIFEEFVFFKAGDYISFDNVKFLNVPRDSINKGTRSLYVYDDPHQSTLQFLSTLYLDHSQFGQQFEKNSIYSMCAFMLKLQFVYLFLFRSI